MTKNIKQIQELEEEIKVLKDKQSELIRISSESLQTRLDKITQFRKELRTTADQDLLIKTINEDHSFYEYQEIARNQHLEEEALNLLLEKRCGYDEIYRILLFNAGLDFKQKVNVLRKLNNSKNN
jgi:hypothetical protein